MREYSGARDVSARRDGARPIASSRIATTCSGGLTAHLDRHGRAARMTTTDKRAPGIDLRHQGDPHRCIDWWADCAYCGIVRL